MVDAARGARVIVLMGVSGSGKTTIGERLAEKLGWHYAEGDAFHPSANVAKMSRGEPLDDDDRRPWLEAISAAIGQWLAEGRSTIVTCSALKRSYREILAAGRDEVTFVHLDGGEGLIAERLADRKGHFMPPALLKSQLATLEPPADAIIVDITPAPDVVVATILDRIRKVLSTRG